MKFLSDEEYERMLQEKLLHIETEIALIGDKIEQFKKERDDKQPEDHKEKDES